MVGFFLLPLALVLIFSGGGGGGGGEGRGSASSLERFVQCTYLNGIRMFLSANAIVNNIVKKRLFSIKVPFFQQLFSYCPGLSTKVFFLHTFFLTFC